MSKTLTLASLHAVKKWVDSKVENVSSRLTALEQGGVSSSPAAKTKLTETLYGKNWDGQKYTITNPSIKADSDIFMTCHPGTSAQVDKMCSEACIACAEQADGKLVLIAHGVQPEQDVVVTLLII